METSNSNETKQEMLKQQSVALIDSNDFVVFDTSRVLRKVECNRNDDDIIVSFEKQEDLKTNRNKIEEHPGTIPQSEVRLNIQGNVETIDSQVDDIVTLLWLHRQNCKFIQERKKNLKAFVRWGLLFCFLCVGAVVTIALMYLIEPRQVIITRVPESEDEQLIASFFD